MQVRSLMFAEEVWSIGDTFWQPDIVIRRGIKLSGLSSENTTLIQIRTAAPVDLVSDLFNSKFSLILSKKYWLFNINNLIYQEPIL